jgi:Leucine-rich repeat (LRR) protein
MKNLKTLILINNNITALPPEFFTLKKLEKIYLDGNPINSNDLELLKRTFKKAEIGL